MSSQLKANRKLDDTEHSELAEQRIVTGIAVLVFSALAVQLFFKLIAF